jgi:23S rRNA (uridine2552-2'-O)-methyltransferase
MRLEDAKNDYYRRLAKQQGYKSRAAFKLLETSQRYRLIRRGDVVIDFGAAPGGWVQVASEIVGPEGLVVALDILPLKISEPNLKMVVGNVFDAVPIVQVRSLLPRKADVLLSDLSPNITGAWDLDHYRQVELVLRALALTGELLKKSGNVMLKVFDGDRFLEARRALDARFRVTSIVKPKASRRQSSELYLVGLGFLG